MAIYLGPKPPAISSLPWQGKVSIVNPDDPDYAITFDTPADFADYLRRRPDIEKKILITGGWTWYV